MDSFLQKFSLQNLLRQFFCGVVFFVPLYLFASSKLGIFSNPQTLETGTFILMASLFAIIGTIIYHLEKNLHSYPLQLAYECYYQEKRPWWMWSLFLSLILAPIICLALAGCGVSPKSLLLVATGGYMLLAFFLLCARCDRIIDPTIDAWCLEEEFLCSHKEEISARLKDDVKFRALSAVSHLSTWSDFIHCVQSCCFSWILGCCIVQFWFVHTNVPTLGDEGHCSLLPGSVIGAVLLLVLEMLVDMHRYRFVKKLTSKSGKDDTSPAIPNRVEPSNTIIEDVQVFHSCDESSLEASFHSSNSNDRIRKEILYKKTKIFIAVVNLILKIVKVIKRK